MSRLHKKLNRRQWEFARRAALDRDNWRCTECGKAGRIAVDHIQALAHGGDPYALANLQSLCMAHHALKTTAEFRKPDPERERWRAYNASML